MAALKRVLYEDEEELVLDALERDQLVHSKLPFGRRQLGPAARLLMWALRAYVLLALVVVAVRVAQAAHG